MVLGIVLFCRVSGVVWALEEDAPEFGITTADSDTPSGITSAIDSDNPPDVTTTPATGSDIVLTAELTATPGSATIVGHDTADGTNHVSDWGNSADLSFTNDLPSYTQVVTENTLTGETTEQTFLTESKQAVTLPDNMPPANPDKVHTTVTNPAENLQVTTTVVPTDNAIQKAVDKVLASITESSISATIAVAAGRYDGDICIDRSKATATGIDWSQFTLILIADDAYTKPVGNDLVDPDGYCDSQGLTLVNGKLTITGVNVDIVGLYFSPDANVTVDAARAAIYGTAKDDFINITLAGDSQLSVNGKAGNDTVRIGGGRQANLQLRSIVAETAKLTINGNLYATAGTEPNICVDKLEIFATGDIGRAEEPLRLSAAKTTVQGQSVYLHFVADTTVRSIVAKNLFLTSAASVWAQPGLDADRYHVVAENACITAVGHIATENAPLRVWVTGVLTVSAGQPDGHVINGFTASTASDLSAEPAQSPASMRRGSAEPAVVPRWMLVEAVMGEPGISSQQAAVAMREVLPTVVPQASAWALMNLLLTVLGLLLTLFLFIMLRFRKEDDSSALAHYRNRQGQRQARYLAWVCLAVSVVSIAMFLIYNNTTNMMVLFDTHTILHALIFVLQLALFQTSRQRNRLVESAE